MSYNLLSIEVHMNDRNFYTPSVCKVLDNLVTTKNVYCSLLPIRSNASDICSKRYLKILDVRGCDEDAVLL